MVESFEPIFMPMATDTHLITLGNTSTWTVKKKYAIKGTNVHTGSFGPTELREHRIQDDNGVTLNSISGKSYSIGCQKNVTENGYYSFGIRNVSATEQTWSWTVTF